MHKKCLRNTIIILSLSFFHAELMLAMMLEEPTEEKIRTLLNSGQIEKCCVFKIKKKDNLENYEEYPIFILYQTKDSSTHNIHGGFVSKTSDFSKNHSELEASYLENVVCWSSIGLADNQKPNNIYTFYIATQEKGLFSKAKYAVKEFTLDMRQHKTIFQIKTLLEHNQPIKSLNIIRANDKNYLVSGSTYPSIKVYDLEERKVVKTLHNRFLLGCSEGVGENEEGVLIYGKKLDNERPKTAFGRWLDSGKQKAYATYITKLQYPFDTTQEQMLVILDKNDSSSSNQLIEVSEKNYPKSAGNKDYLYVVDPQTNSILAINGRLGNLHILTKNSGKTLDNPLIIRPDESSTHLKDHVEFNQQLIDSDEFFEWVRSEITLQSYLNSKEIWERNNDYDNSDFLSLLFTTIFNTVFEKNEYITFQQLDKDLVLPYNQILEAHTIKITDEYLKNKENYTNMRQYFTKDILKKYRQLPFFSFKKVSFEKTNVNFIWADNDECYLESRKTGISIAPDAAQKNKDEELKKKINFTEIYIHSEQTTFSIKGYSINEPLDTIAIFRVNNENFYITADGTIKTITGK